MDRQGIESAVTTIGFVGFGEVASRFAVALAANGASVVGYDVLLDRPGGLDVLAKRAQGAPVAFLGLAEVMAQARLVLSAVTTDAALAAARACLPHLDGRHMFVDLNTTSPAVKRAISAAVVPSGAAFVEGAILAAVGVAGARARILVCGEKGPRVAETLNALGLDVAVYGSEIGRASSFKLLRSVFSKGIEAVLIESLLAARRAGVGDDVWREIIATVDGRGFAETGGNWIRTHGTAHERRYHEMVQVEEFLRELGLEPLLTKATAEFFGRSTRLALARAFDTPPHNADEVVAALDALLRKA